MQISWESIIYHPISGKLLLYWWNWLHNTPSKGDELWCMVSWEAFDLSLIMDSLDQLNFLSIWSEILKCSTRIQVDATAHSSNSNVLKILGSPLIKASIIIFLINSLAIIKDYVLIRPSITSSWRVSTMAKYWQTSMLIYFKMDFYAYEHLF